MFDLEIPYVRAEPVACWQRTINKRPCILETLDACLGACQVWGGSVVTLNREEGLGDLTAPSSWFWPHISGR